MESETTKTELSRLKRSKLSAGRVLEDFSFNSQAPTFIITSSLPSQPNSQPATDNIDCVSTRLYSLRSLVK